MATVSVTQAAKLAGVSRATLYRKYINTGVITVSTNKNRRKEVDTSELLRVFGELHRTDETVSGSSCDIEQEHPDTKKENNVLLKDNELLKQQLRHLEENSVSAQAQIEELQRDKQWLQSQVSSLAESIKLLEHPNRHRYWWQVWK